VGIDDKGIDLTELFQRLQQCRGDRPVEIVFANSSRAVGSWMLDAVPDVQRDARREVRTGAGGDRKATEGSEQALGISSQICAILLKRMPATRMT
jgi:hypothetical protein